MAIISKMIFDYCHNDGLYFRDKRSFREAQFDWGPIHTMKLDITFKEQEMDLKRVKITDWSKLTFGWQESGETIKKDGCTYRIGSGGFDVPFNVQPERANDIYAEAVAQVKQCTTYPLEDIDAAVNHAGRTFVGAFHFEHDVHFPTGNVEHIFVRYPDKILNHKLVRACPREKTFEITVSGPEHGLKKSAAAVSICQFLITKGWKESA